MLTYLEIKNYIFIKHLVLEFDKGLNIFTGETGAGKSIIIEAISLLAGEKILNSVVGNFDKKCEIVGIFDLDDYKKIYQKFFKDLDIEFQKQIIIRREIDQQNRSKCFINDRLVSLTSLKNLSDLVIDIHGQNEHQKLLSPTYQILALDEFSDIDEEIEEYKNKYYLYKKKLQEKENLYNEILLNKQKIDLLKYQINEIEQAKLSYEDENIELEFEKAKSAQKVLNLCSDIKYNISEVKQKVSYIERNLENLQNLVNEKISFSFDNLYSEIDNIENLIEKYKNVFSIYTTEYIDMLVDRVDMIKKFKRKYGNTIKEIKSYYENIKQELATMEIKEDGLNNLEKEILQIEDELVKLAKRISEIRNKRSKILIEEINKEFCSLGLQKAKIDVRLETKEYVKENLSQNGFDKVEFFVSTNPGSPFASLKNIVSGGELSRIMLAIKTVLGKKENTPILIFDEIDSGVSGPMGFVIGKKLKQLSFKDKQIFCITHLPQIACFADKHFLVKKEQTKETTKINVDVVEDKTRVEEIARMLSGAKIDETSLQHARNLLKEAASCIK
ncbi:MAG: DNA repair protein RecN [Endomicrobiia bacterium]